MLPFLIHWKDHPIKLFSCNPVMHHFQSTTTWSPYKIGYPNSHSPDNNSTGNVIFYGWLLLISLINDALLQMLHGEFGRLQMLHTSICIKLLSELRIQGYHTYHDSYIEYDTIKRCCVGTNMCLTWENSININFVNYTFFC